MMEFFFNQNICFFTQDIREIEKARAGLCVCACVEESRGGRRRSGWNPFTPNPVFGTLLCGDSVCVCNLVFWFFFFYYVHTHTHKHTHMHVCAHMHTHTHTLGHNEYHGWELRWKKQIKIYIYMYIYIYIFIYMNLIYNFYLSIS